MRPAASLIIFTTLSGLGFGLATVIGTGLLKATNAQWAIIHGLFSLGFISIGIIASTWHLGHPERAWRALSQWRSSWLSREGVLAGATVMLLIIYVADQIYSGTANAWLGAGLALLSLATIFATAMIYASLKPIPLWHHPLTPINFILWAIAGGLLLAATLATWQGINHTLPPLALITLLIATTSKIAWWQSPRNNNSTPETATGLGNLGKIKMIIPPHTEENWLQHEMGFQIARKHRNRLKPISLILATALPITLIITAPHSAISLTLATILHIIGVATERWLFFAEAKHSVMLYYK